MGRGCDSGQLGDYVHVCVWGHVNVVVCVKVCGLEHTYIQE